VVKKNSENLIFEKAESQVFFGLNWVNAQGEKDENKEIFFHLFVFYPYGRELLER
jgi:hypothetical protein